MVTLLLAMGVDARSIQNLAGHEDITTAPGIYDLCSKGSLTSSMICLVSTVVDIKSLLDVKMDVKKLS